MGPPVAVPDVLATATFERFAEHVFEPRGWDWVDPKSDLEARAGAIDAGLDTRTRVLAERGLNFSDVIATLKSEQDAIQAAGLAFGYAPKPVPKGPQETPADVPEEAPKAGKKPKKGDTNGNA